MAVESGTAAEWTAIVVSLVALVGSAASLTVSLRQNRQLHQANLDSQDLDAASQYLQRLQDHQMAMAYNRSKNATAVPTPGTHGDDRLNEFLGKAVIALSDQKLAEYDGTEDEAKLAGERASKAIIRARTYIQERRAKLRR